MKMKLIFAVAAASALLLLSCRKADEATPSESQLDELEFTATIEGPSTKTTVNTNGEDTENRGKIEWVAGDEITITDASKVSVIYVATNSGTTSTFRKKSGQSVRLGSGPYTATYGTTPSTSQNYADHYKDVTHAQNVYMTAGSETRSLTFKAACGLLKLTLTAATGVSNPTIKQIEVTGTVNGTETTYTLNCADEEGKAVSISSATDFYFTLSAGSYDKMVFCNSEGKSCEKQCKDKDGNDSSMEIRDNMIQPVTIGDVTFYYPGTEMEGIKIDGVIWAPVNCGYDASHTYGLLYQWGRKYGQAYEDGTITLTSLSKNEGQLESNSGKFGKYNEDDYNWFSGGVDNTLWNGSSKGTSDPCPSGWRVPTEAELSALISNKAWGKNTVGGVEQAGYWFNGSSAASAGTGVFLSAAGYRYYNNGYADARDAYSAYWSSSVDGDKARILTFSDGNAEKSSLDRANGYSVRCVQK